MEGVCRVQESSFDIFSGWPDKDARWLGVVEGLENARSRMEHIAAQTPGHYFLFSGVSRSILAQIDTFAEPVLSKATTA